MKTYEELLSDIEEDMELMGASHIIYSAEENGVITDYDYLPSDLCMTSTTLKDLQEKLHEQMLYDKASAYTAGADKNAPKLAVIFPGIGYTADKPLLYYTTRLAKKHGYHIQTVSYGALPENIKGDSAKMKQAFELASEQTEQKLFHFHCREVSPFTALPIHGPKQILFRHSQHKKKFLFSLPKMPTILWKPAMCRPIFPS